jgi:putative transposase
MGVPRGGNAHFKESVYELHKREPHGFSPSVSHRLDHEVSLQGAGRRVAGADTNDIRQLCKELGVQIVSGVLSREHVHMFVEIPPHIAVSDFVRRVKGRSSHQVQMEFPDLRKRYWGRHFWARGYFSTTSGNITDDVILQYLQKHEPTGASR